MKNKKLIIGASSAFAFAMLIGAIAPSAKQVSPVSAVDPISGKITIDTNSRWGDGLESYKTAIHFYDEGVAHEYWTDLTLVESPNRLIEFSYEFDFAPTKLDVYKYSADLDKETWEANRTSSVETIVSLDSFTKDEQKTGNIVFTSDTYGLFRLPHGVYQNAITYGSEDVYLDSVSLNNAHHVEYMSQVELKEDDAILFGDSIIFFQEFNESNFVLDESVKTGDLVYAEGGLGAGYECHSEGTYTFKYDYYLNKMTVSKEVEPTPVDPSDPDTPEEKGDTPSTPTMPTLKDIFEALKKTLKDAWDDLIAHIKRWFKLG